MSAPADAAALEAALAAADAAVTRQGDAVRALKAAAKEGTASKVRERGGVVVGGRDHAVCALAGVGKGRSGEGEPQGAAAAWHFQSPIGRGAAAACSCRRL